MKRYIGYGKYKVEYKLEEIEGWLEEVYTIYLDGRKLIELVGVETDLTEENINKILTETSIINP